ncbi:MAG: hypothetical protein J6X86_06950 [Bacteroidales bacterium]|nr:hypothetical protein [Bacteroidales bacterium]
MKTIKFFIPVLAACMAVFVSCGDNDDDEDYRDAWVGTYVGDSDYHFSANGGANTIDTVYFNDSLSVAKNSDKNLTFVYRGQSLMAECTEEGVFSHDNYPNGGFQGRFSGDSLYFNFSESEQGRSVTYVFKGKKIK